MHKSEPKIRNVGENLECLGFGEETWHEHHVSKLKRLVDNDAVQMARALASHSNIRVMD